MDSDPVTKAQILFTALPRPDQNLGHFIRIERRIKLTVKNTKKILLTNKTQPTPQKMVRHFPVPRCRKQTKESLEMFASSFSLTEREKEVLEVILVSDENVQDIAETLMISRAALYRHIASLNEKTGTKSRIGLVQFYYRYHRRNEG